jgi:geranylgeranyl pyrophosphate synthase
LERGDSVSQALEELIKTRAINEPEGTQKALTIIRENGGVEKTVEMARKYGRAAKDCLNVIPSSPYKTSLEGLVDYILTRTT